MSGDVTPENWRQPYRTLCELLEATASEHAETVYLCSEEGEMTYQQFFTVVDHLAAAWAAEIQGRDVAIFLPNSVAFLACYYAVLRAGGQPALINVGMPPESVKRLLADLKPVMTFSSQPIENFPGNAVTDAAVFELAATLNPAPVTPSTARPAEIGAILFSGGTTGLPKRIRHSHKVLMAKVERMEWGWPTNENEVWLPVAPFTHVYGYLMGVTNPILKGGRVVIPPPFQPDVIVDLLERQRVTVFGGGRPLSIRHCYRLKNSPKPIFLPLGYVPVEEHRFHWQYIGVGKMQPV